MRPPLPTAGVSFPHLVGRVFVPFACGYFLSYLFRTVNAVIAADLVQAVGLTAAQLGLLTSVYFLTFAACQLPLGVLLDRYGPRRVEAALLLVAALGALLFGLGTRPETLVLGRALIGIGVSGCLMAAFKAFVLWFPAPQLPLVNGCIMACGGLGALMATAPVEALLHLTSWRGLFLGLAGVTLAVAGLLFAAVPEHPAGRTTSGLAAEVRGVITVFRSHFFWRLAPITTLANAALFSLQGLWAGPWLRDVAGLERQAVATHLFVIAAALLCGYLALGALASRLQRRGLPQGLVVGGGLLVFLVVQGLLAYGVTAATAVLWGIFGFCGAAAILPYALVSQHFPAALAGRANTALNVLVFVAAFLCQYGMGAMIALWPPAAGGGYVLAAYRASFGALLGLQALAYLWMVWPRHDGTRRTR
ncbi:MAG: membrane protein [Candidatus Tectimicrobiota bacterium]|nr:MAG: membrane protein [Candidatus Tectomicrobia bacterium]